MAQSRCYPSRASRDSSGLARGALNSTDSGDAVAAAAGPLGPHKTSPVPSGKARYE
jgi:hypothetical protein